MNKKHILSLAVGAVVLGGCQVMSLYEEQRREMGFNVEPKGLYYVGTDAQEKALKEEGISIDIIRFDDRRKPESLVPSPDDDIIYEYMADRLLANAPRQIHGLLARDMNFANRVGHVFLAEVDLRYIRTTIRQGDFWSGHYGKYVVDMEVAVTVRGQDSSVLVSDSFSVRRERERVASGGRNPNQELDRKRMMETVSDAARELAVDIGWAVRQGWNKRNRKRLSDY